MVENKYTIQIVEETGMVNGKVSHTVVNVFDNKKIGHIQYNGSYGFKVTDEKWILSGNDLYLLAGFIHRINNKMKTTKGNKYYNCKCPCGNRFRAGTNSKGTVCRLCNKKYVLDFSMPPTIQLKEIK